MPITLNHADLAPLLAATFCANDAGYPGGIYRFQLFGGPQPSHPTITAGIVPLSTSLYTLTHDRWSAPAAGVVTLADPIEIPINATGTATFLRIYGAYGSGNLMDIPVSTTPGDGVAVLSSLSAVSGSALHLTDLRIKLNTVGAMSVSPVVANYFLLALIGAPNPYMHESNGHEVPYLGALSAGWRETSTLETLNDHPTVLMAYAGDVPSSATDPIGSATLLWSRTGIPARDLVDPVGAGLALTATVTANAVATGTPSFLRVVRPSNDYTSMGGYLDGVVTPECVVQIPVGGAASGCSFSPTSLTAGQPATLVQLTVSLAS